MRSSRRAASGINRAIADSTGAPIRTLSNIEVWIAGNRKKSYAGPPLEKESLIWAKLSGSSDYAKRFLRRKAQTNHLNAFKEHANR
jgi:hypothetical protein